MNSAIFKVRVGVVVLDDQNRLLLARQNGKPHWVLPGGTLELGETMGACAVREIKEEANLDIDLGPLLYVWDFMPEDRPQTVDTVFMGHLLGGNLERETTQNIDEIGFFSREEALGMLLMPEPVFKALLADWEHGNWQAGQYLETPSLSSVRSSKKS
jgi:ADP-ribose pyrophosphatase YjhB (NUDIX family)